MLTGKLFTGAEKSRLDTLERQPSAEDKKADVKRRMKKLADELLDNVLHHKVRSIIQSLPAQLTIEIVDCIQICGFSARRYRVGPRALAGQHRSSGDDSGFGRARTGN